jgi:hypothetical protein
VKSGFDDAEPETVLDAVVTQDDFFSVGPGYILSREDRETPDYHFVGKELVLHADSGCFGLPSARGNIGDSLALDDQYAYWFTYPKTIDDSLPPEALQLSRIDIQSGAQTRLIAPSLPAAWDARIVGQDDRRVFVSSGGTLVAVLKP